MSVTLFDLQRDIESKKRKRQRQKDETTIERLVSMGFERSRGTN